MKYVGCGKDGDNAGKSNCTKEFVGFWEVVRSAKGVDDVGVCGRFVDIEGVGKDALDF